MDMKIEIRPLAPALGAEVRGADLSRPLPDDAFARIGFWMIAKAPI